MSVQPGPTFKRYAANGVATIYAIPFLLLDAADLQITLNGTLVTTGFTLAGVGDPTSSCTFAVAPTGDLLFQQVMTFQRLADYQTNGDFLAGTVNRDYDRLWLAVKQVSRDSGRALTVSLLEPEGILALPAKASRALKMLAFDAAGNPITSNLTLAQIEQQPALALESAAAAALSATNAGLSEVSAASSRDLAQKWASNPEDTPVVPGAFSAFHWAAKAFASAAAAAATLANAVSKVGAQTMAGPLTVVGGITSIPFNREYLSPPTTVVANQALSLSHGLGSEPKAIQVYWLVDIAELGYAVGDYIKIGDFAFSGTAADGIMVAMTDTLLKLRIGSVMPLVNNYSTGVPSRVNTANGRLVVRAQI